MYLTVYSILSVTMVIINHGRVFQGTRVFLWLITRAALYAGLEGPKARTTAEPRLWAEWRPLEKHLQSHDDHEMPTDQFGLQRKDFSWHQAMRLEISIHTENEHRYSTATLADVTFLLWNHGCAKNWQWMLHSSNNLIDTFFLGYTARRKMTA